MYVIYVVLLQAPHFGDEAGMAMKVRLQFEESIDDLDRKT